MQKALFGGGVTGVILALTLAAFGLQAQAAETVLIRGIVQQRDGNSIEVNYTHVAEAADKTKWLGRSCDVNVSTAKRFKWEEKSGVLTKTRTTAIPEPGSEVVFRGTISDDCRANASWIVRNYREFTITGSLQGITLDSGKTDAGWITVNVSKLVMRDVVPETKFKESQFKGVDILVRFNGTTAFTALGKAKQADEVSADQQTVVLDGEMTNERFALSKVTEQ